MSQPRFKFEPIVYPDDLEELLDVAALAFAPSGLSDHLMKKKDGEEVAEGESTAAAATTAAATAPAAAPPLPLDQPQRAYRRQRTRHRFEGKRGLRAEFTKVVLEPEAGGDENENENAKKKKIISWSGWQKPVSRASDETPAEELAAYERERALMPPGGDIELEIRLHDLMDRRSEELLGADHKWHYWYLSGLCTLPEWQRRGLGRRLVDIGIEKARDEWKRGVGLGEGAEGWEEGRREVKGCCVIATAEGLRTYLSAGMKRIGDAELPMQKDGQPQRFVWLTKEFTAEDSS